MQLYRKWATVRLRQLAPWIEEWDMEEIFAGTGGKGAADGVYETALQIEMAKLMGIDVTGGACDLYKCFDQIIRELAYEILRIAGMPKQILDAYARFLDNVEVHNTVAGGIGQAFNKKVFNPARLPMVHDGHSAHAQTMAPDHQRKRSTGQSTCRRHISHDGRG